MARFAPTAPLPPVAAYLGIDWADAHHDVALQAADAAAVEMGRVAHTPNALAAWLATLGARFGGRPVAVALETSRGPLVHALLEVPWLILYPINPRSLRRFREAFTPSGAKDDGPDARLLLELLVKHRERLTAWRPDDAATRHLRALVEQRRTAVELRSQLVLQLQATLKGYFPQALTWAGADLARPLALAFLERWPTLAALQRARPATVRRFYTSHGCRRAARLDARLAEMATALPLTHDAAIIAPSVLGVQLLVGQLKALGVSLATLDDAIAAAFAAHPEAPLFQALPGAGAALAPRLLVAFGTDRRRYATAADLQQETGIAPVTLRSGQTLRGPLALGRSDVPPADVPRIRPPLGAPRRVGAGVLPRATCPRQVASRRRSGAGVQVDPGPLALLAGPDPLRRRALYSRARLTRLTHRRAPRLRGDGGRCLTALDRQPQMAL